MALSNDAQKSRTVEVSERAFDRVLGKRNQNSFCCLLGSADSPHFDLFSRDFPNCLYSSIISW